MSKRGFAARCAFAAIVAATVPVLAYAAETITYTYDVKGRLVKVERGDGLKTPAKTEYMHDKANNRTNVTVTGPPNAPPP
jgi:hypothetical protein